MCLLIETIRVDDGIACHLPYHQQRVNRSIGTGLVCLESYIRSLPLPPHGCFKLRLIYTHEGIMEYSLAPYIPLGIQTFRIISADALCYHLKWEDRSAIHHVWEQRSGCDEILIAQNGKLTDSSFANLALFNGKCWITPDKPLLEGTCRARLIDEGILIPAPVFVQDIYKYQQLVLINALLGFDPDRAIPISRQNIFRP